MIYVNNNTFDTDFKMKLLFVLNCEDIYNFNFFESRMLELHYNIVTN